MIEYRCDICKKAVKDRDNSPTAGFGYKFFQFCQKCGSPILKFLKSRKLIVTEKSGVKKI